MSGVRIFSRTLINEKDRIYILSFFVNEAAAEDANWEFALCSASVGAKQTSTGRLAPSHARWGSTTKDKNFILERFGSEH